MAKKAKEGGKKKKKVGGKKGGGKKEHVATESDLRLPPVTDVKCATLQAAVINRDVSSLDRLVAHYNYEKSLQLRDANGSTLIHIAIRRRDMPTLQTLLNYKTINLNVQESPTVGGHTALQVACQTNYIPAVDLLLRAGADPNIKSDNTNGETALMMCCREGFVECGRLLVNAGASLDLRDSFGNNASFWAYKYNQQLIIRELGLPVVHTANADEFLKLLIAKNPRFTLPSLTKPKAKGKDKDGKGKKKK